MSDTRVKALDEKYCGDCGEPIKIKAAICPKCGVSQRSATSKNKTTAGIFALLLGGIGVHKFYLGQVGMGVLYLVFFWTGIPLVVGLIEGIVLLTMSDERFARQYAD